MQKNFPFDPKTAFAPVTLAADDARCCSPCTPSVPAKNVAELIDYAKKNPARS